MNMKPAGVHLSSFIEYGVKNNGKDSKFKVDNYARIAKYTKLLHPK